MMNKIEINKSDVSLQFSNSKDISSTYKVEFYVNLNIGKRLENPSEKLTLRNVDPVSLKKAIMSNVSKSDKDYMDLVSFDTTKATFHLKTDKWLEKCLRGVKGTKQLSTFSVLFKLKQQPPNMIKKDILRAEWNDFVKRKVKQWVTDKKGREQRLLKVIFPKDVVSSINRRLSNMFDWEYDHRRNKVEAKLKSIWIIALLYTTSELTKKESLNKIQKQSRQKLFTTKVKSELKRKSNDRDFKLFTKDKYLTKKRR